jgi:hypothetical protein
MTHDFLIVEQTNIRFHFVTRNYETLPASSHQVSAQVSWVGGSFTNAVHIKQPQGISAEQTSIAVHGCSLGRISGLSVVPLSLSKGVRQSSSVVSCYILTYSPLMVIFVSLSTLYNFCM